MSILQLRLAWNIDGTKGYNMWYPQSYFYTLSVEAESLCAKFGKGTHWIEKNDALNTVVAGFPLDGQPHYDSPLAHRIGRALLIVAGAVSIVALAVLSVFGGLYLLTVGLKP